jgi:uncharacterized protein DUF5709
MSDDTDDYDGGVDIDSGLLEPEDSLDDRGVPDVLDEGYSPSERPIAVFDWGLTAREAAGHEDLGRRLARETPDATAIADRGDGLGDAIDTDGELYDDEVGVTRAGRLTEDPEADEAYPYLLATDVGIDGAAASSEEAAIHVIPEKTAEQVELEKLRRQNDKLAAELKKTQMALDIIGKAHALLAEISEGTENDEPPKTP